MKKRFDRNEDFRLNPKDIMIIKKRQKIASSHSIKVVIVF